ncbi:hypothetical protein ACN47E_007152 [Coniothyrium glycines]
MSPVKISERPDTIAGFDLVVAISEEAVNGQLSKLYRTKLTPERLVPPSQLKNVKAQHPSEHLINHKFSIHLLNKKLSTAGNPVYRTTGINGFIECPKVRFRPEDYDSKTEEAAEKYKKAYLEITFKMDEASGADSTMVYYDKDIERNETIVLSGCTMVWGVKIGRKDIENVMEEVIRPAQDPNRPAATEKKVTDRLGHYIDSQIFTVSTIFCLFEEKSMTESFILLDKSRNPYLGSALGDLRSNVTQYFCDMADEWKANKGTPFATTENPYILGYGISQKKIDAKSIAGENVSGKDTPDCFRPKQLLMSITPGEVRSEWMCTSGSLNYCLLTHRNSPEGHQPVDIDEADLNAGIITENFFDLTKTLGRTKDAQGNIQGHDGIMAFSKGVFSGQWLRSIVQDLLPDPSSIDYRGFIAKGLQRDNIDDLNITMGNVEDVVAIGNGWQWTRKWRTDWMDPPKGQVKVGFGSERQCVLGDCRVAITYTSDTHSISSVRDGLTHQRRIFFDIEFENKWDYIIQCRNKLPHLFTNISKGNDWLRNHIRGFHEADFVATGTGDYLMATNLALRTRSLVRVVMHSGVVGTWNVDVDEGNSKNLFKKDNSFDWTSGSTDTGDYGNFREMTNFNGYTFNLGSKILQEALTGWAMPTKDIIGDKVHDAFKGLTTTIIMPAGDVFTFAGLDSDKSGNVYTQINFANDGGFEVTKGTIKLSRV